MSESTLFSQVNNTKNGDGDGDGEAERPSIDNFRPDSVFTKSNLALRVIGLKVESLKHLHPCQPVLVCWKDCVQHVLVSLPRSCPSVKELQVCYSTVTHVEFPILLFWIIIAYFPFVDDIATCVKYSLAL